MKTSNDNITDSSRRAVFFNGYHMAFFFIFLSIISSSFTPANLMGATVKQCSLCEDKRPSIACQIFICKISSPTGSILQKKFARSYPVIFRCTRNTAQQPAPIRHKKKVRNYEK